MKKKRTRQLASCHSAEVAATGPLLNYNKVPSGFSAQTPDFVPCQIDGFPLLGAPLPPNLAPVRKTNQVSLLWVGFCKAELLVPVTWIGVIVGVLHFLLFGDR